MKKIFTSILFVALALTAYADCLVLDYSSEIKLSTGLTDFGGVQSKALALDGAPYQLTFEGKQASSAVNNCYVQYSTDGAKNWIDLVKPDCGTSYKSFGPYELPKNATHIRFNAKRGSTMNRTFCNIKVTCRTTYGSAEATICEGDSVEYNGVWYHEGGLYEDILLSEPNSIDGDSIVSLAVNVLPSYSFSESQTIYVGAAEEWHMQDLSTYAVGTYTLYDSLQTVAGCDSVYVLSLNVLAPTTYGEYNAAFCAGDSIEFNGVWYKDEFNGPITLDEKNQFGGDSVVTLTVALLPTYNFQDEPLVIYQGAASVWHEQDLSTFAVGVYTLYDSLKTVADCDSVYSVTLVVNEVPVTYGEYNAAFCAGDSIEFNGVWYYDEFHGQLTLDQKNQFGGDSIINLSVVVYPIEQVADEEIVIVEKTDTLWHGQNLALLEVGDHVLYDTLQSVNDCDSIVYVSVTVNEYTDPVGPTAIDNTTVEPMATKILRDGILYIRRDDVLFDLRGLKVE